MGAAVRCSSDIRRSRWISLFGALLGEDYFA
jgi:hypothetical protein